MLKFVLNRYIAYFNNFNKARRKIDRNTQEHTHTDEDIQRNIHPKTSPMKRIFVFSFWLKVEGSIQADDMKKRAQKVLSKKGDKKIGSTLPVRPSY